MPILLKKTHWKLPNVFDISRLCSYTQGISQSGCVKIGVKSHLK